MEFAVLGPLRVVGSSGPVDVTGAKERTVLAHLIASAGRTITVDDMIDELWGETPPRSAAKSVQNLVLRLRNVLEPDRAGAPQVLVTDGPGYRLDVPADAVDALRFARLVDLGRRAHGEGRAESASATLREALALWRGAAYAGFDTTPFGGGEARRLEELRLAALEDLAAADLDLGRVREVVPELESLVHAHPMRERLWELLVLALYRSGRQADALDAYGRARDLLVTELGVEPGEALRRLHSRVLAQDARLMPTVPTTPRVPGALLPQPGPLFGRERHLDVLRDAWRRGGDGTPVMLVVRGTVGSGVRRLVGELAVEVAEEGYAVRDEHSADRAGDGDPALTVLPAGTQPLPATNRPGMTVLLARPGATLPPDAELLDVGPLDVEDVESLLATYVDETTARNAAPDVLRRSGGLPARVHDLAVQVARTRVTERMGRAVTRAETTQRQLDDARADLLDGLSELEDVRTRQRNIPAGTCPWKGLAAYDLEDAPLFAGRERLVAELVAQLASCPVLAVVGSSGSGKSSLLRAGLMAALRDGALPGSDSWRVLIMRPGRHPMRELVRLALQGAQPGPDAAADLLERLVFGPGAGRLVLVVDQLEELWTTCTDAGERNAFLDGIVGMLDGDTRSSLVLAVRSDFAGELADRPALASRLTGATVLVGAPGDPEVRRAIETPAAVAGLRLDVGLADALVADAGDEPGSLPLLSTALSELWQHRDGDRLTLASYAAAGGLRGAVARLAENAYEALDEASARAARVLFLRLAGSGEGQGVTRRRVPLAELAELPDATVAAVIGPLSDARLLSVGSEHVEVAHEALFREWPRLRGWLEEDAAARAVQRRLAVATAEWDEGGREQTELWRGTRLAAGSDFAVSHAEEVTTVEAEFLAAGRSQLDRERHQAEERAAHAARSNRRLRGLLGGVGVLLLVSLVAGALAVRAGERAEREATVAEVRELAAAAVAALGTDPELSVLLAVRSVERGQSREGPVLRQAEEALHRALTASRAVLTVPGQGGNVAWSPDGATFVTEGPEESGIVDVRDARTGESLRMFGGHEIDVNRVTFSRDGSKLATTGDDGTARVWDPGTGEQLHELSGTGSVWAPTFDPDSKTLTGVWQDEQVVRVWDLRSSSLVREIPIPALLYGGAVGTSPDGTRLAMAAPSPERPVVIDLASGAELFSLAGHEWYVSDISWSPDGRWIATASEDATAKIWDAGTGALVHTVTGHGGALLATDWSPDGARLVTGSIDGTARVWEVSGTGVREVLVLAARGTRNPVADVAFSPDGSQVMTGDEGITAVTVFDVSLGGDAEALNVGGNRRGDLSAVEFARDGRLVASSGAGSLTQWDVDAGRVTSRMPPASSDEAADAVRTLAVSPDGTLVAGAGNVTATTVWHLDSGQVEFTLDAEPWVDTVSWSPDSQSLALANRQGVVTILDRTGQRTEELRAPEGLGIPHVAFSPDGRWLAGVAEPLGRANLTAREIVLWDRRTGQLDTRIPVSAYRLEFSPDGRSLAAGNLSGPAHVLDVATGRVRATLEGHTGLVQDVVFTPDGSRVATGSTDGTIRLWDAASGAPELTLTGNGSEINDIDVSPDGRRLASGAADGVVRVWTLDLDELLGLARADVTRDLTEAECREYLHTACTPA